MDILTQLATSVRLKLGEEGMVIWYDSVTIKVIILRNSHHSDFVSFKEIENLLQVKPKGYLMHWIHGKFFSPAIPSLKPLCNCSNNWPVELEPIWSGRDSTTLLKSISDASVAFLCQQIFQFLPKTFSSDTLSLSLHRVLHKVLQINGRATIMPIIFKNYQKLFSSDVKLGFLKKYELQKKILYRVSSNGRMRWFFGSIFRRLLSLIV